MKDQEITQPMIVDEVRRASATYAISPAVREQIRNSNNMESCILAAWLSGAAGVAQLLAAHDGSPIVAAINAVCKEIGFTITKNEG